MKPLIQWVILGVFAFAFAAGCGNKPAIPSTENRASPLTASDLAQLMDFHAWSVPIPQARQQITAVRLVVVTRDGTFVAKLFETGHFARSEPFSSILLGLRLDGGSFTGHLMLRDAKGGSFGWNVNFADPFAGLNVGWVTAGTAEWSGNRAYLGSATSRSEPNYDRIVVLELVK
jgi:hypothetical protein